LKFRIVHRFPWPAEKIREILSTGEDIVPMEKLPNVSTRKVVEVRRDGAKFYRKTEWCVHGQIPAVAQKIIRPEMLTFCEDTVWDDDEGAFFTSIKPHVLKDVLKCTSVSRWSKFGDCVTQREYEGDIQVRLPVIGSIVEKTIMEQLKKNCEQNAKMVVEALTERIGPASA
jgi:hypothetical protein